MKKFLTIRKNSLFYEAFEDDALIIKYLFDYKIIKGRVGFPSNALNKVKNKLEDMKINYRIVDDENEEKDYKNLNQYLNVLAKAKDKIVVEKKINKIIEKLETFDEGILCDILDKIEEIVNEY